MPHVVQRDLGRAHNPKDDVEARCLLAFSLLIGAPFVSADHGSRSRVEVLDLALGSLTR